MSIDVKAFGDANFITEKVRELKSMGLVQGIDFDFSFIPHSYHYNPIEEVRKHAVFTFYAEKYATFYALKWI